MASSVCDVSAGHLPSCPKMANSMCQEYVSVPDFYADRSVFVTGGTGFVGKVLVEKLIRSCPKIKKIFLLIRPKTGQDVPSRLNKLINSPLFEKLRRERPLEMKKIVPILGDITQPELGISEAYQAVLCRQVSVVFHAAATVKFDEKLKLSVVINMIGTQQIVKLCHQMVGLEALVHVSTAYCNCDRASVCERVYPPPAPPEHIIQLVRWMPESLVDAITPQLIGDMPNSYTFTKALAEDMLQKESRDLPIAIVRPSIVLSSLREPVPGWVDNFNGPNGMMVAAGKGAFRSMICDKNKIADLVPVDTVINLMIVAAWNTAGHRGEGISVYNCCTGQQNPIKWGEFVDKFFQSTRKHPLVLPGEVAWYPTTSKLTTSKYVHNVLTTLFQTIPARVFDSVSSVIGAKTEMVKMQSKLKKAADCVEYFAINEWEFKDSNVQALSVSLSPTDRQIFDFDVRNIDWNLYIESYVLGLRMFVLKERPTSLPGSRKHLNRLLFLHQITKLLTIFLAWRFVYTRSSRFRELCQRFISYLVSLAHILAIAVF